MFGFRGCFEILCSVLPWPVLVAVHKTLLLDIGCFEWLPIVVD